MIEYYQVPIGYSFFSCGVVISILVYFSMLLFSFIVPIYQYLMLKNCKHYVEEETICNVVCCEVDWSERALKLAKVYLKFSAFSYLGLVQQLEYERFTKKQAEYAVKHCGANWDEQAVRTARAYLDFSAFSREGLIEQLEYEGFTHEQAVHGVEANGY